MHATRSHTVDCLRGIAALLVVWMHVSEAFAYFLQQQQAISWVQTLAHDALFGVLGVSLFFAISGYLIPASIQGTRWVGLKKFALRRFFRLYPLFWLSIPLGVLTTWWLWLKPISAADIALNFTMLPGLLGAPFVQGLYWTLQVELLFYVLCASLFLLRPHWMRHSGMLFGLAFAFLAWYLWPTVRGVAFDGAQIVYADGRTWRVNLSMMFWGAGLRALHHKGLPLWQSRANWLYVLVWLLWLLGFNVVFSQYTAPLGRQLFTAWFAALLLFLGCMALQRPRSAALAYVGKISYSIYLFHPVVLYSLLWLAQHQWASIAGHVPMAAYVLLVITLTIGLSACLFKWVELPSMALGKRLTKDSQ